MWKRLVRLFRSHAHDGDGTHVSTATRMAILRNEDTRGVDLPTWKTPKELTEMHRMERRAALRVVSKRRTGTE